MLLRQLLKHIITLPTDLNVAINQLILDSRKVRANDLFLAVKGTHLDGRQYISQAIAKGAAAVLLDAETSHEPLYFQDNTPIIPIYQLQKQLGKIAAEYYDYPAKKLHMIGVTGTSGKTSCTHFLAQMFHQLNVNCGLIGTLGSGFYGQLSETGLTTPDAISLQQLLDHFVSQSAKAVAMEVSSHSIDQGRINQIDFEIGIFTNLSQDHLDYHGNMDAYASVKKQFFTQFPLKHRIINADDARGLEWIHEWQKDPSLFAYSLKKSALPAHIPQVYVTDPRFNFQGTQARLISPWGEGELYFPLVGQFNLSNAIAVFTALCVYGVEFEVALQHLRQLQTVPGRMQSVSGHDKPLIVVDYAHKPDALEKVLRTLKAHLTGKLICVFGCGGDRDQSKRPLMGRIAEQLADQVIITNDNPRHENPNEIAQQILQGFHHPGRVLVELDRSKAIKNSIQWASAADCVLIAGKGAETYQQIGDEKFPFDDMEWVKKSL